MARTPRFERFSKRARADRANERARDFELDGKTEEAIAEYERARRIDPDWGVPPYNLGLLYKYEGEWELSLLENQRAVDLDPTNEAAWWNLGIAATALARWELARSAWRSAGVSVPDGEGPIDFPCGQTPIRLNPNEAPEVVWSERLDPARAVIRSIPLPDSGFRYADVILNDGAAKGFRKLGDTEVPVLDCLEILERSAFSTFMAQIRLRGEADVTPEAALNLLLALASARDLAAEDWTTSIHALCKECSEGRPYSDHEHAPAELAGPRRVAIAAPDAGRARALLDAWVSRSGASIESFEVVLDAGAD